MRIGKNKIINSNSQDAVLNLEIGKTYEATAKVLTPIKHKWVKTLMPVCPMCGDMLGGNNSDLMSYRCYRCKCDWEVDSPEFPFLYVAKPWGKDNARIGVYSPKKS